MLSPYSMHPSHNTRECLDDCLLQLILIDTVAMRHPRRGCIAERIIERLMSIHQYDLVMARYDDLTDDTDDETGLVDKWFAVAAGRDSDWKGAMLAQLVRVIAVDGELDAEGIDELGSLAQAIGATEELRMVLRLPLC
jgi:hypothetical protein